jgi:hypothetical protein
MARRKGRSGVASHRLSSYGPAVDDVSQELWASDAREADEKFQAVMREAVARGSERCATAPSSHFGTKAPIVNYTRGDL